MKRLKRQSGITLVALIITIIVMIILVSVTLTFALGENGIIGKSKEAATKYIEAEFEEKVNLIFGECTTKAAVGEKINNKVVANDILNAFDLALEIDTDTGLIKGGTDGYLETDEYSITSASGKITVKSRDNQDILLEIKYSETNTDFVILYNGKIYQYKNYVLNKKDDYYKEYDDEEVYDETNKIYTCGPWQYMINENDNTTYKIVGYTGNGEPNEETGLVDLTIPNKINGKNVTMYNNLTNIGKITGKLTVSSGIELKWTCFSNAKSLELMYNVNASSGLRYTNYENLILHSGSTYANCSGSNLKNVTVESGAIIGYRAFCGANNLTQESMNNIFNNAIFTGSEIFRSCKFTNAMNVTVPENSNIKVNELFCLGENIKNITIKKGSTVGAPHWNTSLFDIRNTEIEKIIIEDGCTTNNLIYNCSTTQIDKVVIGSNCTLGTTTFYNTTVNGEIKIGNNCTMQLRALANLVGTTDIIIGNNYSGLSGSFYYGYVEKCNSIEKRTIGNNAHIVGKLTNSCEGLSELVIGDNCILDNYYNSGNNFAVCSNSVIKKLTLGKNAQINEGLNTKVELNEVTLYLTDEQKSDNSKINTSLMGTNFDYNIDSEKIVWTRKSE